MFDALIHEVKMAEAKLLERRRMLDDCQRDLENYGLEGMSHYELTAEYEYHDDKDNSYFDIFKNWYSKGWKHNLKTGELR